MANTPEAIEALREFVSEFDRGMHGSEPVSTDVMVWDAREIVSAFDAMREQLRHAAEMGIAAEKDCHALRLRVEQLSTELRNLAVMGSVEATALRLDGKNLLARHWQKASDSARIVLAKVQP